MKKYILAIILVTVIFAFVFFTKDEYQVYLEEYNNAKRLRNHENEDIQRVYQTRDGSIVYIIETDGYNPGLVILVEIKDSEVLLVDILEHNETEDYGGYAKNKWFLDRFKGPFSKGFELVKMKRESSNQIVAVTGATYTSKAIVDAVNLCLENYGG